MRDNTTAATTQRSNKPFMAPSPCACGGQCGLTQQRDDLDKPFRFLVFCAGCGKEGPERAKIGDAVRAWNAVRR